MIGDITTDPKVAYNAAEEGLWLPASYVSRSTPSYGTWRNGVRACRSRVHKGLYFLVL
jgi:hypothetical protein